MFKRLFKPKKATSTVTITVDVEPGDTEAVILRKAEEKFFNAASKHGVGPDTKIPIDFKIKKN